MLYIIIGFLLVVIAVLLCFMWKEAPINVIPNWRDASHFLSVQLAIVAGLLDTLALALEQLKDTVDKMDAMAALHAITSTPEYHTIAAGLTFLVAIARVWQQRPSSTATTDPAQK